jgi:Putative zinc-finger
MTHDIETAAAYLAGELTGTDLVAFERHLLTCDACWPEIEAGRRGQDLARRAHERAPAGLRAPPARRARHRPHRHRCPTGPRRPDSPAAAKGPAGRCRRRGRRRPDRHRGPAVIPRAQAEPVAAAVAGYVAGRLPGATPQPPSPPT